jgi:hypothetical protein
MTPTSNNSVTSPLNRNHYTMSPLQRSMTNSPQRDAAPLALIVASIGNPPKLACRESDTVTTASNPVSDVNLPKTGIFAAAAGDFRQIDLGFGEFRSLETVHKIAQSPAIVGLSASRGGGFPDAVTAWLARQY